MKMGYILLEVMVSSLIASMISIAFFGSLYQTNRVAHSVDRLIDAASRAAIIQQQLEKDFAGIFIPVAAGPVKEKKRKDSKEASEKASEQRKPLTHFFYSVDTNDMLQELTFITSNPLQVYWSAKVGKAKPRIARVLYKLVPEKNEEKSYTLMRRESYESLEYEAFKRGRGKLTRDLEVVSGIKKLQISYCSIVTSEEGQEEGKKTEKCTKSWDQEKDEHEQKGKKKKGTLPDALRVKLSVWDKEKERDIEFEFKVARHASPIYMAETNDEKQGKQEQNDKAKNAVQKAQNKMANLKRLFGNLDERVRT